MTVEYKRELTDDLEKEVAAFLNASGGELFIGMDDDGGVYGIPEPDSTALAVIDRIKNNILPATLGLFNVEVKHDEHTPFIFLTIAQGLEKPYYLKKYGMSPKGCYTRIGSQSSPMTLKLIAELRSQRVAHTLSNALSPNQHLSFTQLKIYYAEKGFDTGGEFFLRNLGLLTDDGRYNYAAYLMADNNGNSMKVARFRGTKKLDILERNEYGRSCLIKSTYQILDKLEVINSTIVRVGGAAARREFRLVEKDALREAVLNAILHNDYIHGSYPVVEVYDDRIDVVSSGGLPVGMTEDEFFAGRSHPRNRELMRIFSDMDLCEQLGSGMKKILRTYPRDIFDISEHFIAAGFHYNKEAVAILKEQADGGLNGGLNGGVNSSVHDSGTKLSVNTQVVLEALKEDGTLTQKQLADLTGLSLRTVQRALQELIERKFIVREGAKKNGRYRVTLSY